MGFKDRETVKVTYDGIGFGGLLTILFIGLKLTGHIDWDWLWVLSPLWLPLTIVLGIIAGVGLAIFLYSFIEAIYVYLTNRKK